MKIGCTYVGQASCLSRTEPDPAGDFNTELTELTEGVKWEDWVLGIRCSVLGQPPLTSYSYSAQRYSYSYSIASLKLLAGLRLGRSLALPDRTRVLAAWRETRPNACLVDAGHNPPRSWIQSTLDRLEACPTVARSL